MRLRPLLRELVKCGGDVTDEVPIVAVIAIVQVNSGFLSRMF